MDASTRPDAPGMSRALWAPWIDTSAQPSSSSPFRITRSARRSLTICDGRISRSCGFWLPRASESTSTRSPPTASVSALRSVVEVTTRILAAAPGAGAWKNSASAPVPSVTASHLETCRVINASCSRAPGAGA